MAGTINLTKVGFSEANENINFIVEENADLRRLSINDLHIDEMVTSVNGIKPVNGNVTINIGSGSGNTNNNGGSGIIVIDVTELPTENINEGAFYKLHAAKFISNAYIYAKDWKCHYVTELPAIGEAVTKDMINIVGYYNAQDNSCYGYVDSMVGAAAGIPVGWYSFDMLAQAFNTRWGGVTTNPDDADNTAKVLLTKQIYIYQNGWYEIPFAYEKSSKFNTQWNGEFGNRFVFDMSALGQAGAYLVKVSDEVPTMDQLLGATVSLSTGEVYTIDNENDFQELFPGAVAATAAVIVYDAETLNSTFGLPAGHITNGIYFLYAGAEMYVNSLSFPPMITRIDKKFLPNMDIDPSSFHSIATSGDYNDLINKPDLITEATVHNMIQNAIRGAIGGSY